MYRTNILGLAIQPLISVNGTETQRCVPRSVFSVKVGAGNHVLSTKTLREKKVSVQTNGKDDVYVKCTITSRLVGPNVTLEISTPEQGRADVAKLAKN